MRRWLALGGVVLALGACRASRARVPSGMPVELRIGARAAATLDPPLLSDPSALLLARQIFEPLVDFEPYTLALRPGLAASWDVLDGGKRFVFHLRPGAVFQNGSKVTASDAAFCLNRLAQKDTHAEVAFLLEPVDGFDAVARGNAKELSGVRVVNDTTLEIQLKEPNFDFPYVLTHPSTAAYPRDAFLADPAGFGSHPVGSGPFRLASAFKIGSDLSLEAFPRGRAAKGIQRIRFMIREDAATSLRDFQAGQLDILDVPPGRISAAKAKYGGSGFSSLAAGLYVGFNLKDPALSSVGFRRAISLAISRPAIAHGIYDDSLEPAAGLVPKGLPGRSDDACAGYCSLDLGRAKSLIAQTFPQGPPQLAYDFPGGAPQDALARAIKFSLGQIGISLQLRPQALGDFLDRLEGRNQQLFHLGWVGEYPAADWFLSRLFATGSRDNNTGYSVPEVDSMLQKARSTQDPGARSLVYKAAEARILQDMPVAPLGFFRTHFVARRSVTGFYVDQLGSFEVTRFGLSS